MAASAGETEYAIIEAPNQKLRQIQVTLWFEEKCACVFSESREKSTQYLHEQLRMNSPIGSSAEK